MERRISSRAHQMDVAHQEIRRAVDAFVADLQENFPGQVERVVLYGSVARGDDRPDSDIDLLIVVRDRSQLRHEYTRLVGEWMATHGRFLEVMLVEPDEFRSMLARGNSFIHAVRDEGEVLVG